MGKPGKEKWLWVHTNAARYLCNGGESPPTASARTAWSLYSLFVKAHSFRCLSGEWLITSSSIGHPIISRNTTVSE